MANKTASAVQKNTVIDNVEALQARMKEMREAQKILTPRNR